jgi:hypothetical protein
MRNILLGLAVFLLAILIASSSARAETIFLKCGSMNVLAVDLTNHTVNNYPASITPVAIDWHQINQYGDAHYYIDRTAGTLTSSGTYYFPSGNRPIPVSTDTCSVVSKPPIKF